MLFCTLDSKFAWIKKDFYSVLFVRIERDPSIPGSATGALVCLFTSWYCPFSEYRLAEKLHCANLGCTSIPSFLPCSLWGIRSRFRWVTLGQIILPTSVIWLVTQRTRNPSVPFRINVCQLNWRILLFITGLGPDLGTKTEAVFVNCPCVLMCSIVASAVSLSQVNFERIQKKTYCLCFTSSVVASGCWV